MCTVRQKTLALYFIDATRLGLKEGIYMGPSSYWKFTGTDREIGGDTGSGDQCPPYSPP
jgi:hypothetical protein